MSSLARLIKRLAELDVERARIQIAIDVVLALDPHAASHGQALAAKALQHVNGAHVITSNGNGKGGASPSAETLATQYMITEFLATQSEPVTAAFVAKQTRLPVARVAYSLKYIAKRTRNHPKLVRRIGVGRGSRWTLVGARKPMPKTKTKTKPMTMPKTKAARYAGAA